MGMAGLEGERKEACFVLSPSAPTAHQTPPHGAQDSTWVVFTGLSHQVSPWVSSCLRHYPLTVVSVCSYGPCGSLA